MYVCNRDTFDKPTVCSDERFVHPTNDHRHRLKAIRNCLDAAHLTHRMAAASHVHALGGRGSLLVEFVVLLGAMLLVGSGYSGWAWTYGGYTLLNALAAWLIITRRV